LGCEIQGGPVTVATIVLDPAKRRAGLRGAGRVHWVPAELYEPLARLEGKYAAMDAAMIRWQAILDEAERVTREDA
jgi:hypothetical protein